MPGRMCYVSEKEEGVVVLCLEGCYVSEKEEGVVVLCLEGCVMLVRKKRV